MEEKIFVDSYESNEILNFMFKIINKNMVFSIMSYLLCTSTTILISLENDYTNLTNGALILLLFYSQLILFIANIVFINSNSILRHTKLDIIQKTDILLRSISFFMVNTNLRNLGINITLEHKVIVILCSVALSTTIVIYQYMRIKSIEGLDTIVEVWGSPTSIASVNFKNLEHISLRGMAFYIYSLTIIDKNLGYSSFILKIAAFCYAINIIIKKLKIYYSNIKENNNKLYIVISGLIIGFILNLIVAVILQYYYYDISNKNFVGIKDGMFIIAMLCSIPLFKEYSKS